MEYRRLGTSGLLVSNVGLGTNNFGRRMDPARTAAVIDRAMESGINLLDTSNSYGDGLSEEYIGRALKGKRHDVRIATKVGSPAGEGPNLRGLARAHIIAEVENSLRRLDTDYIDLYQTHWTDPGTPIEETLRALDDLVRDGKVRYIGCSNISAWRLCEADWTSRTLGIARYVSVQPQYNMLDRLIEAELMPFCDQYGVGILPYFPLLSGFLTGKYRRGKDAPEGTRLADGDRNIFTDANFDILERIEAYATERGHTVLELAFAWLLAHPSVSSVIAGATNTDQVDANVKAGEWALTSSEMAEIEPLLDGSKLNEPVEAMV